MSPESISALRLSLQVAIVATALNALIGIPIAYLLARRRFWGKGLVDLLVTLPLVLPPTVVGYYLIVLLGRRGVLGAPLYDLTGWTVAFTWYAAVIASTVMALPLLVRTARAAIDSVDRDLERAAYTLGRSELRTTLEVAVHGLDGRARRAHEERQGHHGGSDHRRVPGERDAPARRLVERRAQHAAPAEEDDEVVARDGGGKHEGERHEHVDGSPAPEAPAREEVCEGNADRRIERGGDDGHLDGEPDRRKMLGAHRTPDRGGKLATARPGWSARLTPAPSIRPRLKRKSGAQTVGGGESTDT